MLGSLLLVTALSSATLFSSDEPVTLQLQAPFNDLFAHARTDAAYAVAGTLSYTDEGRHIRIEDVRVTARGNTSRRESECAFPKLKVQFPEGARPTTPLFAGMGSIKIGTHCGEAPADGVSEKYGRLPNQQSPVRETFVYRLLEAVGVPTFKARVAKITYVYTDAKPGQSPPQDQSVVRNAMLIEGTADAVKRVGARREIPESEFTTAQARFATSDTARLALAEAMIGNFDWCLKMTPDDAYRCDARHPLWNLTAAESADGRARPLMYDFDVAGMVSGRHPWFKDVFNEAFVPSHSQVEIEVIAQLQRARTLFARRDLDAARAEFMARRNNAYQALDAAPLDPDGKQLARRYLDSFYQAIGSDDAFYRPVVVAAQAKPYANVDRAVVCADLGAIPPGTPVSAPMQTNGALVQVLLLDALWHWAPPKTCDAIRGPVWIDASAIGRELPAK